MAEYITSIGLEIHAELNTNSKIFCSCQNGFGGDPNQHCCPICMGFPGTLPVLNRHVVEYACKVGHMMGCRVDSVVRMARKNYNYPDLPKGYQISQFAHPLCKEGKITYFCNGVKKSVRINRVHIEEDAGKLLHDGNRMSLVDLNRCGVPLIEIVTEPDLNSAEDAYEFLETVRLMLLYAGVSDCKMQEGSIRCDVNVSIRPVGADCLGPRCEMKNVNTFSGAKRAIEYEVARQVDLLDSGKKIVSETRRWDDVAGCSSVLRGKEEAEDYRFFPEPDLAEFFLDPSFIECTKEGNMETPQDKMERYTEGYGLSYVDTMNLIRYPDRAMYFEDCVRENASKAKSVASWILGEVLRFLNENQLSFSEFVVEPRRLVRLVEITEDESVSVSAAKKVFALMMKNSGDPYEIALKNGLLQNSDEEELRRAVSSVLSECTAAVAEYKSGKTNVFGFLVGRCMAFTTGKGNPRMINEILLETLNNPQENDKK